MNIFVRLCLSRCALDCQLIFIFTVLYVSVCMTFANEFWATYYSFGMPQNHQYRTWNVFFLTVASFSLNSLAYSFNRTLCVSPSLFSSCFFHFILWNVQSLYIFFVLETAEMLRLILHLVGKYVHQCTHKVPDNWKVCLCPSCFFFFFVLLL